MTDPDQQFGPGPVGGDRRILGPDQRGVSVLAGPDVAQEDIKTGGGIFGRGQKCHGDIAGRAGRLADASGDFRSAIHSHLRDGFLHSGPVLRLHCGGDMDRLINLGTTRHLRINSVQP